MPIETLYTIEETAHVLHKAIQTVRHMISRGEITSIKGRPVLIPESAIREFLARRKRQAII